MARPLIVMTLTHPKPCVDMRATVGDRYRLAVDPAYDAERPDNRGREAAWLTRIPGRYGVIFPWGHRRLGAWCTMSGRKQDALTAVPGIEVRSGGRVRGHLCSEVIVTFDVSLIDEVAVVIKSRRRHMKSAAQQAVFEAGQAKSVQHCFQKAPVAPTDDELAS